MSYIIVMQFLSWAFALMLLFGFFFIKMCQLDLNNPNSKTDEMVRMGMEFVINEYNGRSWAGRVIWVLFWGAVMMSTPLEIFNRRGED